MSRPVADALADGFQIPAAPLRAIRIHAKADVPARAGRFPVVLLSPGAAMPRATVTLVAEDLAAHGYLVLMIDHPGDAAAVELSGGRIRLIDPGFLAGIPRRHRCRPHPHRRRPVRPRSPG